MATAPTRTGRSAARTPGGALTVAVTGASGTLGRALLARLSGDEGVERVVALLRREPEGLPRAPKIELRHVDVRDPAAVHAALHGADVVVHLAFALYGLRPDHDELWRTNVQGTENVVRGAIAGGARRFVYASSAAVYGFHADNPQPLDESHPRRSSRRHFYVRQKVEVEERLDELLAGSELGDYRLRPCGVVGPDGPGASLHAFPAPAVRAFAAALRAAARRGIRAPVFAPPVALQAVHQDDVAQALALAVHGAGPPGAYNLAGDGALPGDEVVRVLGFQPVPLPRVALHAINALPPVIPALGWPEAMTYPVLLDTTRAREVLGWEPAYDTRGALEDMRAALGI